MLEKNKEMQKPLTFMSSLPIVGMIFFTKDGDKSILYLTDLLTTAFAINMLKKTTRHWHNKSAFPYTSD